MSVAKSYAKALYESAKSAGVASEEFDRIESQMDGFLDLLNTSAQAKNALYGEVITGKEKSGVVEAIADKAGYSKLFKNFLSLLASKGRLSSLPSVRDAFVKVRLAAEGGLQGDLIAADPVNPDDIQGLAQAFSKKLGKKVSFRVSTDPTLLAGMKVIVNGVTYDGTLRSQLSKLRDRFVQGYGQ